MKAENFFTQEQKEKIIHAIKDAELRTSGEIRLHIESRCKGEALNRTIKLFKELNMHKTDLHNGTLIYLATVDHKFAIVGDRGINEKVPDNFWEDVKEEMARNFKEDKFVEGICTGIEMIGEKLREFFPYQDDDINELSNDISVGD